MSNVTKRTVFIANQTMPGTSAPVNHSIRMAKALTIAGFKPILLVNESHGAESDLQADGTFNYEGITYIPVGENTSWSNPFGKWGYYLGVKQPGLQYLIKQKIPPVAVILQAPHFPLYLRFRSWCRKHGIILLLETMEWHDRSAYKGNILQWLDAEFRMRVVQRKHGAVLVINNYLRSYYSKHGGQAFFLPPLLDTQEPCWMPKSDNKQASTVRLMFAGSPDRDRHDIILAAVLRAKREGLNVTIEYLGSTREQIEKKLPDTSLLAEIGSSVIFHGKVPFEQVPILMGKADYAVLLREDAKWSRCCFPSKIPEFLSLGIPIICNLTSNLGDYLRDGKEAYLVKELTVDAFTDAIRRATEIANDEAYLHMRKYARQTAEESFDIRRFAAPLGAYIRMIEQKES